MNCHKIIKEYKDNCKIVYSSISCKLNYNEISKMSSQELNTYLKSIVPLLKASKQCSKLRTKYKFLCVLEKDRDSGHEYAIEKAVKYNKICSELLVHIKTRMNDLDKTIKENKDLLKILT
jgi:hypothetical protein